MLNDSMGLILADHKRVHLGELTQLRALAAVPFGGRYRLIDFILSNMVNDGITYVGVLAMTKYKSLLDHIGTGASWDLDRMRQGLSILPPYINSSYFDRESGDLTGLYEFILRGREKYVIIAHANNVFNEKLEPMVREHERNGADMTIVYNRDGRRAGSPVYSLEFDAEQRLKGVMLDSPGEEISATSMGVLIISRERLIQIVGDSISRDQNEFSIEWLLRQYDKYDIRGYAYTGSCLRINSLSSYFQSSMKLLDPQVRRDLFQKENRPIYTKVKNEAPALYEEGNYVSHSLVCDGCKIYGSVSDSVLFRGVQIGKHANLQDCILFQDSEIGEGADLRHVILDKNTVIRPGVRLQGQADYPVVIKKGAIV